MLLKHVHTFEASDLHSIRAELFGQIWSFERELRQ